MCHLLPSATYRFLFACRSGKIDWICKINRNARFPLPFAKPLALLHRPIHSMSARRKEKAKARQAANAEKVVANTTPAQPAEVVAAPVETKKVVVERDTAAADSKKPAKSVED